MGIDIGGTKIEAQIFDERWQIVDKMRAPTPRDYGDLIVAVATLANIALPIGISSAGLVDPKTGIASAANLPISGRTFVADLQTAIGVPISFLNDGDALAVSEANFGAGVGFDRIAAIIIGTGVGGGLTPSQADFEPGHWPIPPALLHDLGLPSQSCKCGKVDCYETYLAGPGLSRIARLKTGLDTTAEDIALRRHADMSDAYRAWCEIGKSLLQEVAELVQPDVIVLAGGLSKIATIAADLSSPSLPPIKVARGGDASGALGAAFVAWNSA